MVSRTLKVILLIALLASVGGSADAQFRGADSLYHKSYLKVDVGLLIYDAQNFDYKWFGIQYEHLVEKKLTLGVSVKYSWGSETDAGIPSFQTSKQMSFVVAPQLRYYVGKQTFKGFYVGPALYYQYMDRNYDRGVLFGVGATVGYQFFIRRKFPIDINLWPVEIFQNLEHPDYGGGVLSSKKPYFQVGFSISFGLPVGKKWK